MIEQARGVRPAVRFVMLEDNVFIGGGTTIMPDVPIGRNSIISSKSAKRPAYASVSARLFDLLGRYAILRAD